MIRIQVNEEEHEYNSGISVGEVVRNVFGKKSNIIAGLVDGEERDFSHEVEDNCNLEPIYGNSNEGSYIIRHSCAHLLAQAVTELFPEAKPTIGPPIDNGFYYDFFMEPIGDDGLKTIEKRMKEHIRKNHSIIREEMDNNALREIFSDNKFKIPE